MPIGGGGGGVVLQQSSANFNNPQILQQAYLNNAGAVPIHNQVAANALLPKNGADMPQDFTVQINKVGFIKYTNSIELSNDIILSNILAII